MKIMRSAGAVPALTRVLHLALLAVLLLFISGARAAEPLVVNQATDVVRQWQPEQRLYVKGDLGVSAAALADLETWLDQNATNWTVVLVENAANERYTRRRGSDLQRRRSRRACAR